jgi:hypothetical protein
MHIKDIVTENKTIELSKAPETLLREIQEALAKLTLYPSHRVDGQYGPLTDAGWRAFKQMTKQAKPEFIGPGSAHLLLERTRNTNLVPNKLPPSNLANRIFNLCNDRGYALDLQPGAVNIIGIEGMSPSGNPNNDAPDQWNDSIGLLSLVDRVPKMLCLYQGTTEPGRYYTMNPLNPGGAARLQLGQHKKLWIVGQHRGYEAMQQVGAATLVRDKNRNAQRDDKVTVERGNGINLHSTSPRFIPSIVDRFSAGCVVIQRWNEFQQLMKLIKGSTQYKNNRSAQFDFTLLWRDWFD